MNIKELPSRVRKAAASGRGRATIGGVEILAGAGIVAAVEASPLIVLPIALVFHGFLNLIDGVRKMPRQNIEAVKSPK